LPHQLIQLIDTAANQSCAAHDKRRARAHRSTILRVYRLHAPPACCMLQQALQLVGERLSLLQVSPDQAGQEAIAVPYEISHASRYSKARIECQCMALLQCCCVPSEHMPDPPDCMDEVWGLQLFSIQMGIIRLTDSGVGRCAGERVTSQ
jgi:hypothetical protein